MKVYVLIKEYCNNGYYDSYVYGEDFMGVYSTMRKATEFVESIINTMDYIELRIEPGNEDGFKLIDVEFLEEKHIDDPNITTIAIRAYRNNYSKYVDEDTYTEYFHVKECELI